MEYGVLYRVRTYPHDVCTVRRTYSAPIPPTHDITYYGFQHSVCKACMCVCYAKPSPRESATVVAAGATGILTAFPPRKPGLVWMGYSVGTSTFHVLQGGCCCCLQ